MWYSIFHEADKRLVDKFVKYHENNPGIYQEFRKLAKMMKSAGREKYSAWAIVNVIRWHRDIDTRGDVFKVCNDFIALYARLLMHEDGSFADFFELRPMKPIRRIDSREETRRMEL